MSAGKIFIWLCPDGKIYQPEKETKNSGAINLFQENVKAVRKEEEKRRKRRKKKNSWVEMVEVETQKN